ncbi:MAG: O-succinylbenzoic acid--CoA ligase [Planctomycetota bacterium]|jgi:O-succinylbenzoic acid--CoA ligase
MSAGEEAANGATWLEARANRSPDAIALVWQQRSTSYGSLFQRATKMAEVLAQRGVVATDRVALLAQPSPQWVIAFHALQLLSAVLVPVGPKLAKQEIDWILDDAEPRLLIVDDTHDRIPSGASTISFDELDSDASGPDLGSALDSRNDAAAATPVAILYTSGTSGTPKGVVLARGNFEASAKASQQRLGHNQHDRWLATLPLHHIGGLSMLVRAVLDGAAVVLEPHFEAKRAAQALLNGDVTMASFVATSLARTLDEFPSGARAASMRAILVGGGPVPPTLATRARSAGLPVATTYGLTEACSQVATQRPSLDDNDDNPCLPLAGTEIQIVDDEILVRADSVMQGYWRRPDASDATIKDGWLRTGDLGALDSQGGLQVFSRRSDLIVSGGENIYPAEVERVLLEHPDVSECAVFGISDAQWGQRVEAAIIANPECKPTGTVLEAWCRQHLANFKVPRRFHLTEDLPRTAAGKVRRSALAKTFNDGDRLVIGESA